ncbi:gelsolin-like protein 2 [Haliotis asinina]|uniref:gelsolin-like protein 2 n=1 Tax=Haliotis asinina TaxID=109174 RepID=UPI00353249CB
MSGLIKAKKYDWKDTNLALFGSDLEKNVKKESAEAEAAWQGCGKSVGLKIWRIVKFEVKSWPEADYGKFYDGDSYIILNTYKEADSEELLYDVHFWIGQHSTQDEYGTAAYKTVELDTFLNDAPIQHREVQGHESSLFKSYFKTITVMRGGAETGFRHVKPEEYTPRLLHFSGTRRNVEVREVPLCKSRVNSDDVFILDLGTKIFQFNGSKSSKDERFKAMQFCQELESERNGRAKAEVIEDESTDQSHEFYKALTGEDDTDGPYTAADPSKELYRLSDASGTIQFKLEKKGDISKSDLDSKDVFILDTKVDLFVWIGQDTSQNEKKRAVEFAHNYLKSTDHPFISVTAIRESQTSASFNTAIAA